MVIYSSIEGYDDYIIDTNGNIFSLKLNRYLRQNISTKGYCKVSLNKDKYRREYAVHRLVAMSFIPNPLNKPQVNHIDGNKLNNCLNNLEWVTGSENIIHAIKTGLRDKAHEKARIDNQKLVLHLSTGIYYDSLKLACIALGLNYASARNYVSGKRKKDIGLCYV